MALEDILKKIRSDIDSKVKEIKEETQAKARAIEAEGGKKGELLKKEILAKANDEAEREKERIIVDTQIQIKKEILSLKQQLLNDVFIKAGEKIRESEKIYEAFLEKILLRFAQGDEEIIFSLKDREKFSEEWLEEFNKRKHLRLKYSKEAGRFSGGVIISFGKKEINASLETWLKEIRERDEAEIAKIIFGNSHV